MNPTVFLIRHGKTELNDPANEKIRGYSDIPLSSEGKIEVEHTRKFLEDSKFPIKRILASPLQRGMLTAEIVANSHARVFPNQGLLPWNLGELTAKPISEAATRMDYLQEYPDLKAPKGESYRAFYDRWTLALHKMLAFAETEPDQILVGVVHSRNLLALPSILEDRPIGDVPVKGGPTPASVTQISKDADEWKIKVIWEES